MLLIRRLTFIKMTNFYLKCTQNADDLLDGLFFKIGTFEPKVVILDAEYLKLQTGMLGSCLIPSVLQISFGFDSIKAF